MVQEYPALFPAAISQGYTLHDARTSVKLPEVRLRRIKLAQPDLQGRAQVFTIAPSGVLPYLTGWTDAVEKALLLRRFSVPYWALAQVFGRDEQYWFRQTSALGRLELVATTVQTPEKLPAHLLADAILDRLVHNAYRLQLAGESQRKLRAIQSMPHT